MQKGFTEIKTDTKYSAKTDSTSKWIVLCQYDFSEKDKENLYRML